MEIVEIAVSELHPYENNPRNNAESVEKVANSIKEFGFKVPIIIDSKNVIVAGHTRLLAAQQLGLEKVPCVIAKDLSPNQIKAFRLVDNKVAELSGWDYSKLREELEKVGSSFDRLSFGFEDIDGADFSGLIDTAGNFKEETKEKQEHVLTCPYCGGEVEA